MRTRLATPCRRAAAALALWAACADGAAAPPPVPPHATIGPACAGGAATQTVSFVHVADLHGNFDPLEDKYGRIRAYFDQVRGANPYAIFTNSGDDHEKGSLAELKSSGAAVTEITRAMQFDARTLGNHEFAWGEAHALEHSRDPRSLVVLSNTAYTGGDPQGPGWAPFGVLQAGCLKIGFLGLLSPPWDETDTPQYVDYFPAFSTNYDYSAVVQQIVDDRRGQVDVLVLLSHLGLIGDRIVAQNVTGLDLILGGHSHTGPSFETIGQTRIVQPDFYGDGATRVDVAIDLGTRAITSVQWTETPVGAIAGSDATVAALESSLIASHAPETHQPLGWLASPAASGAILQIAADAGRAVLQADAALLSPDVVNGFRSWSAGPLTPQQALYFYWVERQPPDTPGISAQYVVEASGATLSAMRAAQPGWTYRGPDPPVAGQQYKVVVNKGAALQPAFFFPGHAGYASVSLGAETWEVIRDYGTMRSGLCKYLDSESLIPPCRTGATTAWTFQSATTPLAADRGTAILGYHDPGATNWAAAKVAFASPATFGIASPYPGAPQVMSLAATGPAEGLRITHGQPGNGAFAADALVSEYTLIMDVFWPPASDNHWRSLLQTNVANADDGDWFVAEAPSGGIGTSGSYFGSVPPASWRRLAVVAAVAPAGGTLRYFIDGAFVGEAPNSGQRWALGPTFLLFTDDNNETQPVYVAGLLFAPYAMSDARIQSLGGTQLAIAGAVHTVSPSAGPNGTVSPSTPQSVVQGETLQLTVVPAAGHAAVMGGSCGGSLDANRYTTAPITADCTVTASFVPTYALTVAKSGTGAGVVASVSPPGAIDCGATCSASFIAGQAVSLSATAAVGSTFTGWSGACTGTGTCSVTMDAPKAVTANFDTSAPPNPPRLANLSTRMQVLTGNDVMIGGFVIGGSASKTVAIVATGPSLAAYGITNPLANPKLTLVRSSDQAVIAANDDWQSAANQAALSATGFAPSNSLEAAILADLAPGAYTAIVEGVGGGTGVSVIGVYEVNGPAIPLINISTRGRVLTGNDVMIGGFIIQGSGPQAVAIVATGPSLVNYGITSPLANPVITLVRSSDQAVLATNDDWQGDSQASQLQSAGFAPPNPLESGLYRTLPPGAYTVIVQGAGGGTGVAVVGVYKVN